MKKSNLENINQEAIKEKLKKYKKNNLIRKKNVSNQERKAKSEEVLFYPISEDDSDMLIMLKNTVNESQITLQQIYQAVGSCQGYNLHYGLLTRNEIKLKTLEAWGSILGRKLVVSFQ
jgi:hypothetical protein